MPLMFENATHEAKRLVQKAKDNGCWMYNIRSKVWFTPEEFDNYAKVTIIQLGENRQDLFLDFTISDPKEGIRIRIAYLKKSSVELSEFTEKVLIYYNFIGKNIKS